MFSSRPWQATQIDGGLSKALEALYRSYNYSIAHSLFIHLKKGILKSIWSILFHIFIDGSFHLRVSAIPYSKFAFVTLVDVRVIDFTFKINFFLLWLSVNYIIFVNWFMFFWYFYIFFKIICYNFRRISESTYICIFLNNLFCFLISLLILLLA